MGRSVVWMSHPRWSSYCWLLLLPRSAALVVPSPLHVRKIMWQRAQARESSWIPKQGGVLPCAVHNPLLYITETNDQDCGRRASALAAGAAPVLATGGLARFASPGLNFILRRIAIRVAATLACSWTVVRMGLKWICPNSLELQLIIRLAVAATVGMIIGFERRTSHRPAGVRTMSLVAMGACIFTLVSQYGFAKADQSRVAASVASGVGFIGAGVITTAAKDQARGRPSITDVDGDVRGLTTASAIWITAGLGMACGAGLFFTATVGALMAVTVLKLSRVQRTVLDRWRVVQEHLLPKVPDVDQVAEKKSGRTKPPVDAVDAAEKASVDKDRKEEPPHEESARNAPRGYDVEATAARAAFRRQAEAAFAAAMYNVTEKPEEAREARRLKSIYNQDSDSDGEPAEDGDYESDDPFFNDSAYGRQPLPRQSTADKANTRVSNSTDRVWVRSRVLPYRPRARSNGYSGLELRNDYRVRQNSSGSIRAKSPVNGPHLQPGHPQHEEKRQAESGTAPTFESHELPHHRTTRNYSKQARAIVRPGHRKRAVERGHGEGIIEASGDQHAEYTNLAHVAPVSSPSTTQAAGKREAPRKSGAILTGRESALYNDISRGRDADGVMDALHLRERAESTLTEADNSSRI